MKRKKQRSLWLLWLFPAGCLLHLWTRLDARAAEYLFARGIYRAVSGILRRITGWIPFSLMELCIVLLCLGGAAGLVLLSLWLFRCGREKKNPLPALGRTAVRAACGISALWFFFVITCGANYSRYSYASYSGLTVEESTTEELEEAVKRLAREAGQARAQLAEDEAGVADTGYGSYGEMADAAREAMEKLGEQVEVLDAWYPRTKPIVFSNVMSMTETTGIFCTFTMEANVNRLAPDYTIPAVMCHELSHLQGFMREDEANYITYAACMQSDDPAVRYSGSMLALVYAGNRLYEDDPEAYRRARACYTDGMIRDLQADREYWEPYRDTDMSRISEAVNQIYLKSQDQKDGTKSYGRMVDLLLAQFRKENEAEK